MYYYMITILKYKYSQVTWIRPHIPTALCSTLVALVLLPMPYFLPIFGVLAIFLVAVCSGGAGPSQVLALS